MLDSMVGIFILAMTAVALFSLVPAAQKLAVRSNQQSKAIQMTSRMIENLQLLRPSDLNATTLTSLNLIDAGQANPPFTFNNMPLDDSTKYSPSKALPGGTGTMTIANAAGNSKLVTVTISWTLESRAHSYSSGTILGGYR